MEELLVSGRRIAPWRPTRARGISAPAGGGGKASSISYSISGGRRSIIWDDVTQQPTTTTTTTITPSPPRVFVRQGERGVGVPPPYTGPDRRKGYIQPQNHKTTTRSSSTQCMYVCIYMYLRPKESPPNGADHWQPAGKGRAEREKERGGRRGGGIQMGIYILVFCSLKNNIKTPLKPLWCPSWESKHTT